MKTNLRVIINISVKATNFLEEKWEYFCDLGEGKDTTECKISNHKIKNLIIRLYENYKILFIKSYFNSF